MSLLNIFILLNFAGLQYVIMYNAIVGITAMDAESKF